MLRHSFVADDFCKGIIVPLLKSQWHNYERRSEAIASGRLAQGGEIERKNNFFLLCN